MLMGLKGLTIMMIRRKLFSKVHKTDLEGIKEDSMEFTLLIGGYTGKISDLIMAKSKFQWIF